jgi:hypothetical protein
VSWRRWAWEVSFSRQSNTVLLAHVNVFEICGRKGCKLPNNLGRKFLNSFLRKSNVREAQLNRGVISASGEAELQSRFCYTPMLDFCSLVVLDAKTKYPVLPDPAVIDV